MPLPKKDQDMIVKLLAMTASTSDGEALTAIRKANNILDRNKIHWVEVFEIEKTSYNDAFSDIFRPKKKRPQPSYTSPVMQHSPEEIEKAFKIALANAGTKFKDFLLSLQTQWNNKRYLTPKQEASLMKAKQNAEEWAYERKNK